MLSSPTAEISGLGVVEHAGVSHLATRMRGGYAFRTSDFLAYLMRATALALRLRPQLIYASNPLSCLPASVASMVSGAEILYHEHDSPSPGDLRPLVAGWRAALARQARLVVTPNCERGRHLQDEIKFPAQRLRTVWNQPRRAELPALPAATEGPHVLHYHGSIAPSMLPRTVAEAVQLLGGRVRLRITGYEASSGRGYVKQLVDLSRGPDGSSLVEYAGQVPRADLLAKASQAHVGLALAPPSSENINLRHLVGASNKAFDYMAAGSCAVGVRPRRLARNVRQAGVRPRLRSGQSGLDRRRLGLVRDPRRRTQGHGGARTCEDRRRLELRHGVRLDTGQCLHHRRGR